MSKISKPMLFLASISMIYARLIFLVILSLFLDYMISSSYFPSPFIPYHAWHFSALILSFIICRCYCLFVVLRFCFLSPPFFPPSLSTSVSLVYISLLLFCTCIFDFFFFHIDLNTKTKKTIHFSFFFINGGVL